MTTVQTLLFIVLYLLLARGAAASPLLVVDPSVFSGSATSVTYSSATYATKMHGTIFGGVLHEYSVNDVLGADGSVFFTAPGLETPSASGQLLDAVLSLTFPDPINLFGFDFVLNMNAVIPNAVSVRLFDASDGFLGELSFGSNPIPGFAGRATKGFAGVASSIAFERVELRFDQTVPTGYPAVPDFAERVFAIDNLLFEEASIPEPSAALMLLPGLALPFLRASIR